MSNQVTAVMRDSLDQRSVTSSSPHTSVCQTVFSGTVVKVEKPGEKKPFRSDFKMGHQGQTQRNGEGLMDENQL